MILHMHMHLTVFRYKICPFLNYLYKIWTEHLGSMIGTIRTVLRTVLKLVEHVYDKVLFSTVRSYSIWINVRVIYMNQSHTQ